jgi:hypothetical protein
MALLATFNHVTDGAEACEEHRAQGARHRAQGTGHRAQGREHPEINSPFEGGEGDVKHRATQ